MAETRPSGTPLIPDSDTPVIQEVAEVNRRGQIHILRRWAVRVGWLPVPAVSSDEALMVFLEPGRLSIQSWEPWAPKIIERFQELEASGEFGFESLRLIQDRYARLIIPKERRPYLGDSALQHLGLPTARKEKSNVYVVVGKSQIELLSLSYRDSQNVRGHPELNDLP